ETPSEATSKPAGFKPRFKAGVTKSESVPSEPVLPADDNTAETSKPTGFKPRFKAGVTKTENTVPPPDAPAPDSNIIAPTSAEENGTTDKQNQDVASDSERQTLFDGSETATPNRPSGFKPRFKPGLTKIDKKEE
ncbi:hypothetical protein, partial [Sphingobacterium thalpophilum]|uniref:hypothetical protein n=1 Tax=Sphingobacterium thalpophilum TaxID=259 RepID=UPI0031D17095